MSIQSNDRFRELVLYICLRAEGDEWFGATKLNKLLFFIDMEAFRQFGHTLTEQEYQKLEHGPVPRRMDNTLHSMEEAGDLVVRERRVWVYPQRRPFALREPNLEVFSASEISLVDRVIDRYKGITASQISDRSHDFLGWRLAGMREKIPFGVGLISERALTEAEKDFATSLTGLPEFANLHV